MTNDSEPVILAVETALRRKMSVSILRSSGEVSSWSGGDDPRMSSSAVLLPAIASLLVKNCVSFGDLEMIAVSGGPGSFTGIRVGLATVKALAFGLDCPSVCVSTLEVLALMAETSERIFAVIPAGKNQVYRQFFCDLESADLSLRGKPNLEDFQDFIEELNLFLKTAPPGVTIVTDELTAARIKNSFDNRDTGLNIKIASDNISKYVGLRVKKLFCGGRIQASQSVDLNPFYVRPAITGGR